jgi:hypothetical protein
MADDPAELPNRLQKATTPYQEAQFVKTVAQIINQHGGIEALKDNPLKIEVAGFERLCIEATGIGPRGLEQVSIAHYFEQNGDLICDPDLVVELLPDSEGKVSPDIEEWGIVSIQHPYGPVVEACWVDEAGRVMVREKQIRDIRSFARIWDRNLREQGFLDVFQAQLKK